MRIGVISDTHGDQYAVRQALKAVPDADMWLHAGDYSQDAAYLSELVTVPVYAAKGNCDGQTVAKIDEFVEAAGKKIWLTHGHRYSVKQGVADLIQWGRHYGMDIVIYGHTHVPDNNQYKDLLVFNPGSAAEPRSGHGTCGILTIDNEGKITGQIVELIK
jgi:putative phosphoesterase